MSATSGQVTRFRDDKRSGGYCGMINGTSGHLTGWTSARSAGHHTGGSGHAQRSVQRTHSEASTERAGSISVRTDDGDIVNISFAATESLRADTYQAQSRHGRVAAANTSESAAYAVEVQVNGSLSDQEVADITALMGSLMGAVADARGGNLEGAAQTLGATEASGSLAAYRFAHEEQSVGVSTAQLSLRG